MATCSAHRITYLIGGKLIEERSVLQLNIGIPNAAFQEGKKASRSIILNIFRSVESFFMET
jgi:hypothetical protein